MCTDNKLIQWRYNRKIRCKKNIKGKKERTIYPGNSIIFHRARTYKSIYDTYLCVCKNNGGVGRT